MLVHHHYYYSMNNNTNNDENDEIESQAQQQQHPVHLWNPLTMVATSPAAAILHVLGDNRTSCQGWKEMFLSSTTTTAIPAPAVRARHMVRRQKTVDLILEETAEKNKRLSDAYKVNWRKSIGAGAFGAVYRAVDKQTNEAVAVKKISKAHTSSATFEKEMSALLLLQEVGGHPNICSLREHFEEGDSFYLVLDLVEGGEMFFHLIEQGPYSEADAARLFRQAASALALLHGVGIVHSDLKPENLMLSSTETDSAAIKLVDFGCARFLDESNNNSNNKSKIGTSRTTAYCPPEVVDCYPQGPEQIDKSFDMWSLGVILYIMLTGVHPFDEEGDQTDLQMEAAIMSGKLPLRQSEHAAQLSEDAKVVIEGLMSWDPETRWTADQLLQNDWVRGKTASSNKMEQSDKRLLSYRRHKTKVGTNFFRTMLKHSDMHGGSDTAKRTSILESAFRELGNGEAALSTRVMANSSSSSTDAADDASLSFSEISGLLSENMVDRYYQKGDTIYNEGDKGDTMYFINSGSVLSTNREGFQKERKVGELFGVSALMNDDKQRHSDTKCLTHVHVLEISRKTFEKYVEADQGVELTMKETNRLRKRERASTILGLQKNMKIVDFDKDDVIFKERSQGDMLYILEEGKVDILVGGHKVRSLKKGEMTGEHAAFHQEKPYNVTAKCVGDKCVMSALSSLDMHTLFANNPSLGEHFQDIILRRDFKKALVAATQKPFPETSEELREAFASIDLNKSGEIKIPELQSLVRRFDPSYSDSDIHCMLTDRKSVV